MPAGSRAPGRTIGASVDAITDKGKLAKVFRFRFGTRVVPNYHFSALLGISKVSMDGLGRRARTNRNRRRRVSATLRHGVIREVGLRDGLQSIQTIISTERKCEWLRDAVALGQREIEVGSFVPPKLLPQMADTAEVLAYAKTLPGLFVSALVPNLKGAERALEGGADLMILPASASRAHSLANLRKTPDEVVAEFARIRAVRDASGRKTLIEGGVGTAFGCTIQGEVKAEDVLRLMQGLLDAGADRVSLADTVGYADPAAVSRLFDQALKVAGDKLWCGHFHDTRGLALANVLAALKLGIARFDASLAGIGGCPHAPGASGNASTEDLAYMLESMGIDTGIDVEALLRLRAKVADWLQGESTYGSLWRAGLPTTFRSARVAAHA